MGDLEAAAYGDAIADVYDALHPQRAGVDAAAQALARLACGGPALELGIGTGRIALPLARAGVEVHGVDASEAMVAKLRGKPGGADIPVQIGDFADVDVESRFSLIYVVFNTFFSLLTQEDQIRCFRNVARRLTPEGVFVVEAFVPDPCRFTNGQRVNVGNIEGDVVTIDLTRHDPVQQMVISQKLHVHDGRTSAYPLKLRYAWPSELDLMAQLAGLRLRSRWADWDGAPVTAESANQISVYAMKA